MHHSTGTKCRPGVADTFVVFPNYGRRNNKERTHYTYVRIPTAEVIDEYRSSILLAALLLEKRGPKH